MTKRWIDVVERKPVDTRTGDEIALDVMKNAGLSFAPNPKGEGGE